MITNKNPYIDEDFDWPEHFAKIRRLQRIGFIRVPDWFPAGLPGYKWAIIDGIECLMLPRPKLWHRIRYQILRSITPIFIRRWKTRKLLVKAMRGS